MCHTSKNNLMASSLAWLSCSMQWYWGKCCSWVLYRYSLYTYYCDLRGAC
jgi:hypothetical protein